MLSMARVGSEVKVAWREEVHLHPPSIQACMTALMLAGLVLLAMKRLAHPSGPFQAAFLVVPISAYGSKFMLAALRATGKPYPPAASSLLWQALQS